MRAIPNLEPLRWEGYLGVSLESWEDARRNVVETAAGSLSDLRASRSDT
jgi:hypothetical protein